MTLQQWEDEILAETLAEFEGQHPIKKRFVYVLFVSKSKGRNRRRNHPVEVELIADLGEPYKPPRFWSGHLFSYDTKATDVYQHSIPDGDGADMRLRREIPQFAQRKVRGSR